MEVKIDMKEDAKILQQKGRPVPIHLQNQVAEEIKRLIKNRRLFREPGSHHGEERQISKNCTGFKKIKRSNNQKESTNAEHGRANIQNITEDI